jgi:hypothetical protein
MTRFLDLIRHQVFLAAHKIWKLGLFPFSDEKVARYYSAWWKWKLGLFPFSEEKVVRYLLSLVEMENGSVPILRQTGTEVLLRLMERAILTHSLRIILNLSTRVWVVSSIHWPLPQQTRVPNTQWTSDFWGGLVIITTIRKNLHSCCKPDPGHPACSPSVHW